MILSLLALAAATVLLKGAGPMLGRLPAGLTERFAGLAPALLAALVVTEVAGADGTPQLDAKAVGVAVAVVLAAVRAPLLLTVAAGAAATAVLRGFLGWE